MREEDQGINPDKEVARKGKAAKQGTKAKEKFRRRGKGQYVETGNDLNLGRGNLHEKS